MTATTPQILTPQTEAQLQKAQADRIEKMLTRLMPLLTLLEKPINGEEANLIDLLFQRLKELTQGQLKIGQQVAELDRLFRDVMGDD